MTIVFLARRFYPLIGGVEKHVYEISKRLVEKGHHVIVITEHSAKLPKHEMNKSSGIEIYRINTGKNEKTEIWKSMWKLRKVIQQADVVHCHDVFFWYLPFRFLYPSKPVFTTFHGYESFPIKKSAIRMRKLSEKLSWGNICIGDFIKKWYGTNPTFVSYGAVDISSKYKVSSSKYKEDSALFIGRLDEQTGILSYDEAVKNIRKQNPNFNFCAIGDGEYNKKLDKKTKVLGFRENPERFFKDYHFAFVSRYLAILEAFSAKRLVFAVFDNPVKEDYLKMAPFAKYMIIAGTPEELAKKIHFYMEHPEEETKLVEQASRWVKKQTWEAITNVYLKLWIRVKINNFKIS